MRPATTLTIQTRDKEFKIDKSPRGDNFKFEYVSKDIHTRHTYKTYIQDDTRHLFEATPVATRTYS